MVVMIARTGRGQPLELLPNGVDPARRVRLTSRGMAKHRRASRWLPFEARASAPEMRLYSAAETRSGSCASRVHAPPRISPARRLAGKDGTTRRSRRRSSDRTCASFAGC